MRVIVGAVAKKSYLIDDNTVLVYIFCNEKNENEVRKFIEQISENYNNNGDKTIELC